MSKKIIISIIVAIAIAVAAIGTYLYFSSENGVKPEKIALPNGENYNLFKFNGETMLLMWENSNTGKTAFYYSPLSNKNISQGDFHELTILNGSADNVFVKVVNNKAYIVSSFWEKNHSYAAVIKLGTNMNVEKKYMIQNIKIFSFTFHNGLYYIFGQNGSVAEMLLSNNMEEFKETTIFKDVKFLMASYFVTSSNSNLYLLYHLSFGTQNISWHRTALLMVKGENVSEIYNTSGEMGHIYICPVGNKLYAYLSYQSTTLLIFDSQTNKLVKRVGGIDAWVLYHDTDSNITVGISNYFSYSTDGIHFKNIYPRGELKFDITSKDVAVAGEKSIYVLVYDYYNPIHPELLKFDLSGMVS